MSVQSYVSDYRTFKFNILSKFFITKINNIVNRSIYSSFFPLKFLKELSRTFINRSIFTAISNRGAISKGSSMDFPVSPIRFSSRFDHHRPHLRCNGATLESTSTISSSVEKYRNSWAGVHVRKGKLLAGDSGRKIAEVIDLQGAIYQRVAEDRVRPCLCAPVSTPLACTRGDVRTTRRERAVKLKSTKRGGGGTRNRSEMREAGRG